MIIENYQAQVFIDEYGDGSTGLCVKTVESETLSEACLSVARFVDGDIGGDKVLSISIDAIGWKWGRKFLVKDPVKQYATMTVTEWQRAA